MRGERNVSLRAMPCRVGELFEGGLDHLVRGPRLPERYDVELASCCPCLDEAWEALELVDEYLEWSGDVEEADAEWHLVLEVGAVSADKTDECLVCLDAFT